MLANITSELTDLKKKLTELKNHFSENNPNDIDPNDDLDEFEIDDINKNNKTKSGNNTLLANQTKNSQFQGGESDKTKLEISPESAEKKETTTEFF